MILCGNVQTVLCANLLPDQLVQVTPAAVRLLPASGDSLLNQWEPPNGLHINLASASSSQVCALALQPAHAPFVLLMLCIPPLAMEALPHQGLHG